MESNRSVWYRGKECRGRLAPTPLRNENECAPRRRLLEILCITPDVSKDPRRLKIAFHDSAFQIRYYEVFRLHSVYATPLGLMTTRPSLREMALALPNV